MLRLFSVAVICGALLHISPVNAASGSGEYAVKGVGLATCKMYLDEKEKASNRYFQFVGWVIGYLSGHNRYGKDVTDIPPWQTTDLLAAFIGNYCKANPEERLVAATNRMIGALHPTRLRNSSKRVEAKAGGKTVIIYEAILRRAQQMLSERGFYTGATDGKFGPAMERAIRKFQKDKKIGVTGLPDQRTLLILFR